MDERRDLLAESCGRCRRWRKWLASTGTCSRVPMYTQRNNWCAYFKPSASIVRTNAEPVSDKQ
jgi:hypothetical protein